MKILHWVWECYSNMDRQEHLRFFCKLHMMLLKEYFSQNNQFMFTWPCEWKNTLYVYINLKLSTTSRCHIFMINYLNSLTSFSSYFKTCKIILWWWLCLISNAIFIVVHIHVDTQLYILLTHKSANYLKIKFDEKISLLP